MNGKAQTIKIWKGRRIASSAYFTVTMFPSRLTEGSTLQKINESRERLALQLDVRLGER